MTWMCELFMKEISGAVKAVTTLMAATGQESTWMRVVGQCVEAVDVTCKIRISKGRPCKYPEALLRCMIDGYKRIRLVCEWV